MGEITQTARGTHLYLTQRHDVARREIRKDRPWARVEADEDVSGELAICIPRTHAETRSITECLVADKAANPQDADSDDPDDDKATRSYVDSQQIWTVLSGRFRAAHQAPLTSEWLKRVDQQLKRYFSFADGPRITTPCQGLVVTIRLRSAPRLNDAWRQSIAALLGINPATPSPWSAYAIVVNHERYSLGSLKPPALPLVTVVPLVRRPIDGTGLDDIQVASNGPLSDLIPAPAILLTVDPRARSDEGLHRVDVAPAAIGRIVVPDHVRRELLNRVRWSFGLGEETR